jgi:hypothetical protein
MARIRDMIQRACLDRWAAALGVRSAGADLPVPQHMRRRLPDPAENCLIGLRKPVGQRQSRRRCCRCPVFSS